jgi:hypothetical protein
VIFKKERSFYAICLACCALSMGIEN